MKLTTNQELLLQEVEPRFQCYFFLKRTYLPYCDIDEESKNIPGEVHARVHTYICKWHRSTVHIPIFSSKDSKTITDYVSPGTDDEMWWGWNAQFEVNRLIYGVKQNNGVRATVRIYGENVRQPFRFQAVYKWQKKKTIQRVVPST